jgi:hypothetical protein
MLKRIRLFFLCIFGLLFTYVSAQDEYKAEIGLIGGGAFYLGDANKILFHNSQLTYGGFARYHIDSRISIRGELNNATIGGVGYNFTNQITAGDITGEFNFVDLELNPYKRLSKPFSTYIFGGVGMMTYIYNNKRQFKPSYVFGLGLKYKFADRWNLNAQWSQKLLLTDQMEGLSAYNNLNGLNGSNIFKNDLLSSFTLGISLDVWEKPCDCKNNNYQKKRKRR